MTRRSLWILVVALAGCLVAVAWSVRTCGDPGAPPEPAMAPIAREPDGRASPALEGSIESPSTRREPEGAVLADANAELADAIWVEGRVVLPPGTPADEHVEVIADGASFAHRELHRAPIGPDGSF